jgi:hypothetical protein
MTDKTNFELTDVKGFARVPTVTKVKTFVSDNWFSLMMLGIFGVGLTSIVSNAAKHREEVQGISVQNAGCIYLESSKLGEGQHYMICNGQIVLKRVSDEVAEATPEEKLEEVVPTNATATPAPAK